MHRRAAVSITVLSLIGGTMSPGCASYRRLPPEHIPGSEAALETVRRCVVSIDSASGFGSAIVLDERRLLTCRHAAPAVSLMPELKQHGVVAFVKIDGRPMGVKVLAAGATDAPDDEWAVLEVVDQTLDRPPLRLAPERELRLGETALVIGYWQGPDPPPQVSAALPPDRRQWTLRSRVVERPPFMQPEVVTLEHPRGQHYNGLSGGAVVVWDEPTREFVVVGVCYGNAALMRLGVVFDEVMTARRVPPEALAP